MTRQLNHILYEKTPVLFRAVAFGRDGRPWHLFQQAWGGERENVRAGQIIEARVRALGNDGGVFLDHIGWKLWQGGFEPLYCDRKHSNGLREGQTLLVKVLSAGRRDHAAKVAPYDGKQERSHPGDAFAEWASALAVDRVETASSDHADLIDTAFDEAVIERLALPDGGAIYFERTRALTAIDVDAADRRTRGSASARALSLNKSAVSEVARQISLRGLGGLFAVDCVEPLNDHARGTIRDALIEAVKAHDRRPINVLKPSKFGLLEASVAWRDRPIDEALGQSDIKLALELKAAHREMMHDKGGLYTLALVESVYEAYLMRKSVVEDELQAYFHGRLIIERVIPEQEGLKRR
ncbi:MAG: ribonuclease E/G [Pseudomonadota bacterium]